jgi:hypothetical protein
MKTISLGSKGTFPCSLLSRSPEPVGDRINRTADSLHSAPTSTQVLSIMFGTTTPFSAIAVLDIIDHLSRKRIAVSLTSQRMSCA